jgi:hypothetical protein
LRQRSPCYFKIPAPAMVNAVHVVVPVTGLIAL